MIVTLSGVPRGLIVGETDSHTTQVTLLKFGSARTAVGEAELNVNKTLRTLSRVENRMRYKYTPGTTVKTTATEIK